MARSSLLNIEARPAEITSAAGGNNSVNPLTVFGLFAVSAMVVCYALERRSRWFILAFAGACALASAYGFLQGAWPFGLVEAVWSIVATRRWWRAGRAN